MKWFNYNEVVSENRNCNFAVFGAGHYGQRLVFRLIEDNIENIIIYDNDEKKYGESILGIRISKFDAEEEKKELIYLIAGNDKAVNSNAESIYGFLRKHINDDRIFLVKEESLVRLSKKEIIDNSLRYVNDIIKVEKKHIKEKITKVRSIAYRTFDISKIAMMGGAGKVLYTQEVLLGDKYNNIDLCYSYKKENWISLSLDYTCPNVLGAVEFAKEISSKDEDTAYISHDIFSAAGLAANGKKYALVYHSQGETVYEMEKMGVCLGEKEKELIYRLEEFSLRNAFCVVFPSSGAKYFFGKTWGKYDLKYKGGDAAYNTLLPSNFKSYCPVSGVEKDDDYITFFSVGQMTTSKGMDRIPMFLEIISKYVTKKIRWIVVANGVLKEKVRAEMDRLCLSNSSVDYIQFDFMEHEQINYLFSISDVYIMLHRISIFDLATLEAMYHNLQIVLSNVPGNTEFNVSDNINLVDDDTDYKCLMDRLVCKKNYNRKIYDKYFSNDAFVKRYGKIIDDLVNG